MGMKLVQGGILVALVGIAGLLYSIKQQMTPQPAAAPVTQVGQVADPALQPAGQPAAVPQPSYQQQPAYQPAPQAYYQAPSQPAYPAARPAYQTIPRQQAARPAPAPAARASRPAQKEEYEPLFPQQQASQPVAQPAYQPAPQQVVNTPPPAPAPPPVQSITVPAGTAIAIRMLDGISTERNRAGDTFQATLEEPLIADGVVVADRGATVIGRVVAAQQSGRVAGLAELALELDRIRTVAGEVQIASDTMIRRAETSKGKDAVTAGTMAGIGAAIGAIAGGRRGAGIGAATGGAAGAGTVMATRGKPVEFEPEARLTFRLRAPITVSIDNNRVRQSVTRDAYDPGRPRLERRN